MRDREDDISHKWQKDENPNLETDKIQGNYRI